MSGSLSAPLRVLLVDDEAPARQRLRALLDDLAAGIDGELLANVVVGEAADGAAALDWLRQGGVADVALVDIRMPGMDGMALAEALRQQPDAPAVIFVTAYDSHAVTAFELNATDYLLKPVRLPRLRTALQKISRRRRDFLTCHDRGALLRLPLADILYLRADHKYVEAATASRSYWLDESLVQLEQACGERFLRIHRSILVARAAVIGLVPGEWGDGGKVGASEGEVGCGERTGCPIEDSGENEKVGWTVQLAGCPQLLPVSRRQLAVVRELLRGAETY